MADDLLRPSRASPQRSDSALARRGCPLGCGGTRLRASHGPLGRANAVLRRSDAPLCARPSSCGEPRLALARRPCSAAQRCVARTREPHSPRERRCDSSRRPSSARRPRTAGVRETVQYRAAENRCGQPTRFGPASGAHLGTWSTRFAVLALRCVPPQHRQTQALSIKPKRIPPSSRAPCRSTAMARRRAACIGS